VHYFKEDVPPIKTWNSLYSKKMKQQKLNTVQLQHINTPQACPEVPESMSRIFVHLLHYAELSPADFKHTFSKYIFCGFAYLICINLISCT
jgi:hypothetical protein